MRDVEPEERYISQIVIRLKVNHSTLNIKASAATIVVHSILCQPYDQPNLLRVQRMLMSAEQPSARRILNNLWVQSDVVEALETRSISGDGIL